MESNHRPRPHYGIKKNIAVCFTSYRLITNMKRSLRALPLSHLPIISRRIVSTVLLSQPKLLSDTLNVVSTIHKTFVCQFTVVMIYNGCLFHKLQIYNSHETFCFSLGLTASLLMTNCPQNRGRWNRTTDILIALDNQLLFVSQYRKRLFFQLLYQLSYSSIFYSVSFIKCRGSYISLNP